ncbi:MAG: hypothetical protein QMD46_12880 [Methanomicrobiales archaeon]|nr:hypothetical protein [Methanomicrobiales archaeon]
MRVTLVCPVCRSRDIYAVAGGYLGSVYRCKRCGYWGPLVLEHDGEDGAHPGRDERRR